MTYLYFFYIIKKSHIIFICGFFHSYRFLFEFHCRGYINNNYENCNKLVHIENNLTENHYKIMLNHEVVYEIKITKR